MHENRHFLSYRKRRHDAENHVHPCALRHSGESLQNGQQPQGNQLEKIPVLIFKDEAATPLSVVGPLFISSLLFLEPCQVRGVSVFFVLFTLAFTTGQTSSGSLPFIGCFILFSQFSLVCFIICKKLKVLFVLVQQTSDLVASLGQGLGLGQLPVLAIHCFFLLACSFVSRFTIYIRVRGVVSMFNETSHSFFVWGSS